MNDEERLAALEITVHRLLLGGSTDNSHQLHDISERLDALSKRLDAIPKPTPALSRTDVEAIVSKAVAASQKTTLAAIGSVTGTKLKLLSDASDAKINGIQSSAAMARSAARASIESAVIILEHFAYSLKAEDPTIPAAAKVDSVFKQLEATILSVRHQDPPDRHATPGQLMRLMVAGPVKDIGHVKETALFAAVAAVDRINKDLDLVAEKGIALSQIAGFLRGEEPLPDNAGETLKSAAITLKTAAASGFPATAVAAKLDAASVEFLSSIRTYQKEVVPRQKSALAVTAAATAAEAFARASKSSSNISVREELRRKSFALRDTADDLRQIHRKQFPRRTSR